VISDAFLLYESMLERGVAKETARRILPLCTPTTLYMQGTLRSWIHFILIRTSEETQLEHRVVAEQCLKVFQQCFPTIAEAALSTL
jgi:thymidylate synthase (FAD)